MQEYDEPEDLIRPEDFLPQRAMPADALRMGLDRNTEEGALVALAAALDPAKRLHRVLAWVMLLAVTAPVVLGPLHDLL